MLCVMNVHMMPYLACMHAVVVVRTSTVQQVSKATNIRENKETQIILSHVSEVGSPAKTTLIRTCGLESNVLKNAVSCQYALPPPP